MLVERSGMLVEEAAEVEERQVQLVIRIPLTLRRRAKLWAVEHDGTIRALVIAALEERLAREEAAA